VGASRKALEEAIKLVRPGRNTQEIGAVIEETIEGFGFKPVYNLTGHGLEHYVQHAEPPIPNKRIGQGVLLQEGQVIAIEPLATNGVGIVVEGPLVEIFSLAKVKPVRMPHEREALKAIQEFNGLPFARRWLSGIKYIDRSLTSLMRQGIIYGYPVLVEHNRGLVSQAEHTMIVTADGCTITT
jgi:methionyl aminopeptidase